MVSGPSQLIAEVQKATPQAPVYATIRPSQSPQSRQPLSFDRSSLNSLPAALNSTPLIKSVATSEEPIRIHPTNPFYSTLPSNYTNASRLPIPNGRSTPSSIDKNKPNTSFIDYSSDLKSPSYFIKNYDSGPSSLPYTHHNVNMNGYESKTTEPTANTTANTYSCDSKFYQHDSQGLPNDRNNKNPFETKRNSDPFEKYVRSENKTNGKNEQETQGMSNSQSDNNFHRKEVTERSTVTEHKFSEIEEIKTIKKMILNGSGESNPPENDQHKKGCSPKHSNGMKFDFNSHRSPKYDLNSSYSNEYHSSSHPKNDSLSSFDKREEEKTFNSNFRSFDKKEQERKEPSSTSTYQPTMDYIRSFSGKISFIQLYLYEYIKSFYF